MKPRSTDRAAVALIVLLLLLLVTLVAACGGAGSTSSGSASAATGSGSSPKKDAFAGTWVDVKDANSSLVIEKNADGSYSVHDPDGANRFTARPSGDTLAGQVEYKPSGGKTVMVDVRIVVSGDTGTYTASYNGTSQSIDMRRQ